MKDAIKGINWEFKQIIKRSIVRLIHLDDFTCVRMIGKLQEGCSVTSIA